VAPDRNAWSEVIKIGWELSAAGRGKGNSKQIQKLHLLYLIFVTSLRIRTIAMGQFGFGEVW
jgi:hypothetical protein